MSGGTLGTAADAQRSTPFVVSLAALIGFAKALFEGIIGAIGVFAEDVNKAVAAFAIVFAVTFAIASWRLVRGSRTARHVTGALTLIGLVVALVYAFGGPTEALVPGLVSAGLNALVLWLLYGTSQSRAYFA